MVSEFAALPKILDEIAGTEFRAERVCLTPLEQLKFSRLPKNWEIVSFLRRLGRRSKSLSARRIGRSAKGREIFAAVATRGAASWDYPQKQNSRLRIMIVGSQHGQESSGAEALQMILRDLSKGPLTDLLRSFDLLVIPCANPDGRDLAQQSNGNAINLNSDYSLLSQPESRAIAATIGLFRPHVLLDVHESASFKRRTLGQEGFLTDFEAQFDPAGHPAIDDGLRVLGLRHILPKVLSAVNAKGLRAQRYVGEISSVRATISHGSLSAVKLRNYAGLQGILGMVLENRLDRSDEIFPTPRNIKIRAAKQYLSIVSFLETCAKEANSVVDATDRARRALINSESRYRLPIIFDYEIDPRRPKIVLAYRNIATKRPVNRTQSYLGRISASQRIVLPSALAITRHQKKFARLLDVHGVRYAVLNRRHLVWTRELKLDTAIAGSSRKQDEDEAAYSIVERTTSLRLAAGDLWVDLHQPMGRIAALILDPRSQESLFRRQPYREMLECVSTSFVVPILKEL